MTATQQRKEKGKLNEETRRDEEKRITMRADQKEIKCAKKYTYYIVLTTKNSTAKVQKIKKK